MVWELDIGGRFDGFFGIASQSALPENVVETTAELAQVEEQFEDVDGNK